MNIRSISFWIYDFLRGGIARRHYADLQQWYRTGKSDEAKLSEILNWASREVPFYKTYSSWNKLSDFPVINKSVIRSNENAFLCPKYDKTKLFVESTSGSTGTPLLIYQDPGKRKRARADTIFFSELAGFDFGTKLYYSRVWNMYNRKSKLSSMLQNIEMVDSDRLSDDDMSLFMRKLEDDSSAKSVLIFASTLSCFYRYIKKMGRPVKARVKSFITMSESLPRDVKYGIQDIFGCPVCVRYSDCECGIIAQQIAGGADDFLINSSSFYVEVLRFDSDLPVREGEPGRIVVTDLYNKSMPLIRYDTGDVGVLETKVINGQTKTVFSRVDGRRVDCIYSTAGVMLSPYVIINTMWRFQDVLQYQFVQESERGYMLKVNLVDNERFQVKEEIENALRHYVGEDADISFEIVDEIPLLASGKRKQVVNNYKK